MVKSVEVLQHKIVLSWLAKDESHGDKNRWPQHEYEMARAPTPVTKGQRRACSMCADPWVLFILPMCKFMSRMLRYYVDNNDRHPDSRRSLHSSHVNGPKIPPSPADRNSLTAGIILTLIINIQLMAHVSIRNSRAYVFPETIWLGGRLEWPTRCIGPVADNQKPSRLSQSYRFSAESYRCSGALEHVVRFAGTRALMSQRSNDERARAASLRTTNEHS